MPRRPSNHKEVPDGMMVGQFAPAVEDDPHGVGKAAQDDAVEGRCRHLRRHLRDSQGAHPPHHEVKGDREPFPLPEEEELVDQPREGHAPDHDEVHPPALPRQIMHEQGRMRARNQEVNTDVVEHLHPVLPPGIRHGMVNRGRRVHLQQGDAKHEQAQPFGSGNGAVLPYQQGGHSDEPQQQPEGVRQRVGAFLLGGGEGGGHFFYWKRMICV